MHRQTGDYCSLCNVYVPGTSFLDFLLVCPMYDILHVLHVSLYIPFMLYSWFLSGVFGFIQCCIVFVLLNAILMLVCLKIFVIFLIYGLWYVKVAHFFVLIFILPLVDFLLLHLDFQVCYELLSERVVYAREIFQFLELQNCG